MIISPHQQLLRVAFFSLGGAASSRTLAVTLSPTLAAAKDWPHVDTALGAGADLLVAHTDDAPVDGTGHAVLHLHVQFWQQEGGVDTGLAQVPLRGGVNDVPDLEALDGLVLRHAAGAIAAADDGRVPAAVLAAAIVPALGRHGSLGLRGEGSCSGAVMNRSSQSGLSQ